MRKTHTFEVGQELAIGYDAAPPIYKIKRVTPTGIAVLNNAGETKVNPDLTIRGAARWGPYSCRFVTQEIRDNVECAKLSQQMRAVRWSELSLTTLRTVAFVLEHSK
jgi:hypothetical protein